MKLLINLALASVGAACLFSGCGKPANCKHEARMDRIDSKNQLMVDISEWAPEGQTLVIGVCVNCGTITHAKSETANSLSVVPVSNGIPIVSFGYPTKQARLAMDRAHADLIERMEASTNAVIIRDCRISADEFKGSEIANSNRFLVITGCDIR